MQIPEDDDVSSYMLYEPVEISLTANNDYANPYTEVDLWAEIKTPDGSNEESYKVYGFWDGGRVWKIRWVARSSGSYNINVFSNKADTGFEYEKTVKISKDAVYSQEWAPAGFLQVHTNSEYFKTSNGENFIWFGDTQWISLYDRAWGRTTSYNYTLWKKMIDKRSEYGFNLVQSVLWNDSATWEDGENPFTRDFDLVNPLSWQRLEERIIYAVQNGIVMNLLLSSDGQILNWSKTDRNRLQKYAVARFGAYNVIFGGGEEVDRDGYFTDSKGQDFIQRFHEYDPYGRNTVGLHAEGFGTHLLPEEVDYFFIQLWGDETRVTYSVLRDNVKKYSKPYVNGETFYYCSGEGGNCIDTPEAMRAIIWRTYMSGAAGYSFGTSSQASGNNFNESQLEDGGSKEMKKAAQFFLQPGLNLAAFTRFEKVKDKVYLAGDPGKKYIAVNEISGSYNLNLSDSSSTLTARWFDISTGQYSGGTFQIVPSSSVQFVPDKPWMALCLEK